MDGMCHKVPIPDIEDKPHLSKKSDEVGSDAIKEDEKSVYHDSIVSKVACISIAKWYNIYIKIRNMMNQTIQNGDKNAIYLQI